MVKIDIEIPDLNRLSVEDARFIEKILRAASDRIPVSWKRPTGEKT